MNNIFTNTPNTTLPLTGSSSNLNNLTISSNTTSGSYLIYNGSGTYNWGTADSNNVQKEYFIGNHSFELDRSLTNDEIMFLSLVQINGIDHYDNCIKNGMVIPSDLNEKIQPILKMLRRDKTIKKVLNNGN